MTKAALPTAAPLVDRLTKRQIRSRQENKFRDGTFPEVVRVPVLVSRKQLPRTSPEKRLTAKIFKILDAIQQDSKLLLKGRWNSGRLRAANELFGMLDTPLTAKICLVWALSHLKPIEASLQIARDELDEAVVTATTDKQAIAALLQAQARLMKEHRETLEQIMDFAAKAQEPTGRGKPKNLPPTIALQVNVPGVPSPSPAPGTPARVDSSPGYVAPATT